MADPLELWFEFASTYSYPAVMRAAQAAEGAGVTLVWRPFLLGPIFRAQGWNDSPFNLQPAKGRYMWRDLERLCARYGLPFRRPSGFPRNGLLAARVAVLPEVESWRPDFVRAVFHAEFAEDRDIGEEEAIAAVLAALGRDARRLLAAAGCPPNKQRLRRQTEAAVALGIFGAPTFVSGQELFWGNDRLEEAVAWHQGHREVD